jgi:hypothetical protein
MATAIKIINDRDSFASARQKINESLAYLDSKSGSTEYTTGDLIDTSGTFSTSPKVGDMALIDKELWLYVED